MTRPNCAECLNLESGGWCKALRRSVSGSRHTRKCDSFEFARSNPVPVRKGFKQPPGLVQCVSCIDFIPWGECGLGQAESPFLSHSHLGRLEPRIWRRCTDYAQSDIKVRCVDCVHLDGDFCLVGEYPVTGKDKQISCQFHHGK
jgi:hypothetical protein